jgi:hypothetical protein
MIRRRAMPIPARRRARALRDALRREQTVGPFSLPVVAALGTGFVASFIVDALLFDAVRTPWRQLADAGAFAAVAAPVWLAVENPAVRRAHEVVTWLNGWETERWQREVGRRLPAVPRATPALLEDLPDTMGLRPLRVELLAVNGRLGEARDRLDRLPAQTAWERFERAALEEWLAWWSDAPSRLDMLPPLAEAVEDPERRLVARVMVAAAHARRAATEGGDAAGPLAVMRPELGSRPSRYAFPYRTGVIVGVLLISLVASLAVTIAAALLR